MGEIYVSALLKYKCEAESSTFPPPECVEIKDSDVKKIQEGKPFKYTEMNNNSDLVKSMALNGFNLTPDPYPEVPSLTKIVFAGLVDDKIKELGGELAENNRSSNVENRLPFHEDIETLVTEVAKEKGVPLSDAMPAWQCCICGHVTCGIAPFRYTPSIDLLFHGPQCLSCCQDHLKVLKIRKQKIEERKAKKAAEENK
eukprot:TRINITY_DN3895_c0_g1_i1.p1 TRINITY_DN3895_c0_g1~~TRINITY_DN3895_c0_g1_i1.p1  ORF type:complete len:219 (-),score=46.33 TRINITY_DN3895_c0_g1_i1:78-674(-)